VTQDFNTNPSGPGYPPPVDMYNQDPSPLIYGSQGNTNLDLGENLDDMYKVPSRRGCCLPKSTLIQKRMAKSYSLLLFLNILALAAAAVSASTHNVDFWAEKFCRRQDGNNSIWGANYTIMGYDEKLAGYSYEFN